MKVIIETGSGAHTTSSASVQAKFADGPFNGQHLYQQKQFQVRANWDDSRHNEKWVTTEYDLPEGQEIEVIGRGRTGERGSTKWAYHRIYRLDPAAEVKEREIPVGLRRCTLKGRLVLVRDLLKEREVTATINMNEGF